LEYSTLNIVNSKAVTSGIVVVTTNELMIVPAEFLVASSYVGGVMG